MKILFVCSGNGKFGISPIVLNQGESLKRLGLELEYFVIEGKGLKSYFLNIFKLKPYLKYRQFDIIHAHYSLSALLVTLSHSELPLVVSLMGSDSKMNYFYSLVIRICSRYFWRETILKSESMNEKLKLKKYVVIPNGVDINKFYPIDRIQACSHTGFNPLSTNIIFFSEPSRPEKNFALASEAIGLLNNQKGIEFKIINSVQNTEVPFYLNSMDILLSTSIWEGSPNIIKEAMACNSCVVSTDVGDVKYLFEDEAGYFVAHHDKDDVALKLRRAIKFIQENQVTKGRDRLINLGLTSESVALKLYDLYHSIF